MAGTWGVSIQVADLAQRTVRVQATRTEGEDVRVYSAEGTYDTVNNTPQALLAKYTSLFWDLYQGEVTKEAQIAALVGQVQTALANALDAKETP